MVDLQQFDRVLAAFHPRRSDDLRDDARQLIGARGEWVAMWEIDDGPYQGEWAMRPVNLPPLAHWVPSGDLADMRPLPGPAA